jgi:hypothetical protein
MVCVACPGKACWVVGSSRYMYGTAVVTGGGLWHACGVVISPSLTCCRTWCMRDMTYGRMRAFFEAAGVCLELFTLQ